MLGNKIHAQYDITKFLGLGRFGETYLAKSKDLPGQPLCVLRRFRPPDHQPFSLVKKSFETQGELLYQLGQHDQIPRLLAKLEDGENLYLVQEYIEGELLSKELLPGKIWSQQQVIDLLQDVLGILEFVHHQNLIHRDINPQNLIRRWRDGKFVLLGCSGIKDLAAIWAQPADEQPSELVGTPGYIPFEQEEDDAQFNTDIYALGIIAIQALTGQVATTIERHPESYQLTWKHLTKANLRLVEIIDRMVRPDYRNRYQVAREVLDDLRKFQQIQIKPTLWDNLRPHLIFGTASVALLTGLAISTFFPGSSDRSISNNQPVTTPSATPSLDGADPFSASSPAPSASTAAAAGAWTVYKNQQIQISHHPQWQSEETKDVDGLVTFWSPSNNASFRPNVTVQIEKLADSKIGLSKYTQQAIEEIKKSLPAAKIIESSDTKLADRPAFRLHYSDKPEGLGEVQSYEIWTVQDGKAYVVRYRAQSQDYSSFLSIAQQSIKSFKILP
jgi:eukaryotic-like serine/threonine-protein kinase